ncbi:oligosaccharide flippase family protein [Companilactobacillus furfuricola]|uniref:oligosaccharide flippase family protein n=1 Tax=Companilactobacillus furfuricola TaxID=1462575 RepID=UPI000F77850D|nr:oligosaccharide flippase family protein [Companilactobacillus furfuricola]
MKKEIVSKAIKGTWILTVASFVSELLSAIYRIPLQNIVGDRGYFIYQQVYPLYGIFSVLALTGLPVVFSKMFAQQENQPARNKLFKVLFFTLLVCTVSLTVILWGSSRAIATFMGDPSLYLEIRTVSLAFLLVPFEATLRGAFQSDLNMGPSAISQLLEQLLRILLIIVAAVLFGKGLIDIYKMGALANSGAFVGGVVAVVVLAVTFFRRERNVFVDASEIKVKLERGFGLEIVLIVFFTGITIFYQFIDSFSMIRLLMHSGMSLPQAEISKGIFDRAQPLIQLGIVISVSFISTIMPQLKKRNQGDEHNQLIRRMTRVCLTLAIAETAGLIALMPDINTMLFTDSQGSVALAIYMCSIFLVSTINLLIAVTSGDSSKNMAKLILFILSMICKIFLNVLLVPRFYIAGAAVATVVSELVILLGLLVVYHSDLKFLVLRVSFVLKTVLAGAIMALSVRAIEQLFVHFVFLTRKTSILINLILIPVGIVIFVFLVWQFRLLSKKEWEILPLGKKLTKIMKIEDK